MEPGAVRMYGWSEAEALEMNIRDLSQRSCERKRWPLYGNLAGLKFWSRIVHNGSPKMALSWRSG